MTNLKLWSFLTLSIAGLATMVTPATAEATPSGAFYRVDSSACDGSSSRGYFVPTNDGNDLIGQVRSGSAAAKLACPLPDNSWDTEVIGGTTFAGHVSLDGLQIFVFDGITLDRVQAAACIVYWGANGGSCGAPDTSGAGVNSFKGWDTLIPGLSVVRDTTHYGEFAMLQVSLPAKVNFTDEPSRLAGFVGYM